MAGWRRSGAGRSGVGNGGKALVIRAASAVGEEGHGSGLPDGHGQSDSAGLAKEAKESGVEETVDKRIDDDEGLGEEAGELRCEPELVLRGGGKQTEVYEAGDHGEGHPGDHEGGHDGHRGSKQAHLLLPSTVLPFSNLRRPLFSVTWSRSSSHGWRPGRTPRHV